MPGPLQVEVYSVTGSMVTVGSAGRPQASLPAYFVAITMGASNRTRTMALQKWETSGTGAKPEPESCTVDGVVDPSRLGDSAYVDGLVHSLIKRTAEVHCAAASGVVTYLAQFASPELADCFTPGLQFEVSSLGPATELRSLADTADPAVPYMPYPWVHKQSAAEEGAHAERKKKQKAGARTLREASGEVEAAAEEEELEELEGLEEMRRLQQDEGEEEFEALRPRPLDLLSARQYSSDEGFDELYGEEEYGREQQGYGEEEMSFDSLAQQPSHLTRADWMIAWGELKRQRRQQKQMQSKQILERQELEPLRQTVHKKALTPRQHDALVNRLADTSPAKAAAKAANLRRQRTPIKAASTRARPGAQPSTPPQVERPAMLLPGLRFCTRSVRFDAYRHSNAY